MSRIPHVPTVHKDARVRLMAQTVNKMLVGRSNNVGEFSLESGATETVVENNLFESEMVPVLVPSTEAAASEPVWIKSRSNGQFTVGHTSDTTERTFLYCWIG